MNTENKNSRRDFVKASALITGGIMATPLLSKANFFSGADDAIKIALIGCGGRGTGARVYGKELSKRECRSLRAHAGTSG